MNHKRINKDRVASFLPGLVTTASLCFGLMSVGLSVRIAADGAADEGLVWRAAAFVGVSMILDMLDGRIARALGAEDNRFGVVYDSLSDAICFGVAPVLLLYSLLGGNPVLDIGLLIYAVCAVLRLARFNMQSMSLEKRNFMGLPSPMAAGVMISPVFVAADMGALPLPPEAAMFYAVAAPVAGFFMVSGIRYKKAGFFSAGLLRGKRFDLLVTSSVIIAVVAINTALSLAFVSFLYFISGPLFLALKPLTARRRKSKEAEREISHRRNG